MAEWLRVSHRRAGSPLQRYMRPNMLRTTLFSATAVNSHFWEKRAARTPLQLEEWLLTFGFAMSGGVCTSSCLCLLGLAGTGAADSLFQPPPPYLSF